MKIYDLVDDIEGCGLVGEGRLRHSGAEQIPTVRCTGQTAYDIRRGGLGDAAI